MRKYTLDYYRASAEYLLARLPKKPEVALILGSSLGPLADEIADPIVVDYMPISPTSSSPPWNRTRER